MTVVRVSCNVVTTDVRAHPCAFKDDFQIHPFKYPPGCSLPGITIEVALMVVSVLTKFPRKGPHFVRFLPAYGYSFSKNSTIGGNNMSVVDLVYHRHADITTPNLFITKERQKLLPHLDTIALAGSNFIYKTIPVTAPSLNLVGVLSIESYAIFLLIGVVISLANRSSLGKRFGTCQTMWVCYGVLGAVFLNYLASSIVLLVNNFRLHNMHFEREEILKALKTGQYQSMTQQKTALGVNFEKMLKGKDIPTHDLIQADSGKIPDLIADRSETERPIIANVADEILDQALSQTCGISVTHDKRGSNTLFHRWNITEFTFKEVNSPLFGFIRQEMERLRRKYFPVLDCNQEPPLIKLPTPLTLTQMQQMIHIFMTVQAFGVLLWLGERGAGCLAKMHFKIPIVEKSNNLRGDHSHEEGEIIVFKRRDLHYVIQPEDWKNTLEEVMKKAKLLNQLSYWNDFKPY